MTCFSQHLTGPTTRLSLFTPQKGWPRGFEFGTHRAPRHLRRRDIWEAMDAHEAKLAF